MGRPFAARPERDDTQGVKPCDPRWLERLDQLRTEHHALGDLLTTLDATEDSGLASALRDATQAMLTHLSVQAGFYAELRRMCAEPRNAPHLGVVSIFEANMEVESASVRRFFERLDTTPSHAVRKGFEAVARVVRARFAAEETAIFPLSKRLAGPGSDPRAA